MQPDPTSAYRPGKNWSTLALLITALTLLAGCFLFYPKWKKGYTEATLSWDVSGYYMYLPAAFIHRDLKKLEFLDTVLQKYIPTPDMQQAFQVENGNYVMKYPAGMAIMYSPWFIAAHLYASNTHYQADGFSPPYQFMISLGSVLIAILGLFLLIVLLRRHFSDRVSAIVILLIALGTNYLDYTAINGAMTHNYLFTLYAALLLLTDGFYRKQSFGKALGIGLVLGMMALIRPTEILAILLILAWGLGVPDRTNIIARYHLLAENWKKVLLAIIACAFVGFIQLSYWKYVSGDWLVYSYQDQGFSWLRPHIMNGLFHYRHGWLIYTPLMFFALLGFYPLYKYSRQHFAIVLAYLLLFIYIAFAWDIWWYGGSLGQRTMVQIYPLLAFPLAAFVQWISGRARVWKILSWTTIAIFVYFNLWLTYQAHRGGIYKPEQMTKAYFWRTLGKYSLSEQDIKLLDNPDQYNGEIKEAIEVYRNDFESDTLTGPDCGLPPIQGNASYCLNAENQASPFYSAPLPPDKGQWLRATADFACRNKEWNIWRNAQFMLHLRRGDDIIKTRTIRVYRFLDDGHQKTLHLDLRIPDKEYDNVGLNFWNSESDKPLLIDNIRIELLVTE